MPRVGSALSARLGTPGNLAPHTAVRRGVTAFTHPPVLADLGRGKGEAGGDAAASETRKAGKAHPDRRTRDPESLPKPSRARAQDLLLNLNTSKPGHPPASAPRVGITEMCLQEHLFYQGSGNRTQVLRLVKEALSPRGHFARSCFPSPISDNLTRLPRLALMSISSRLIFLGHSESTLPSMAKPLLSLSLFPSFPPFASLSGPSPPRPQPPFPGALSCQPGLAPPGVHSGSRLGPQVVFPVCNQTVEGGRSKRRGSSDPKEREDKVKPAGRKTHGGDGYPVHQP